MASVINFELTELNYFLCLLLLLYACNGLIMIHSQSSLWPHNLRILICQAANRPRGSAASSLKLTNNRGNR